MRPLPEYLLLFTYCLQSFVMIALVSLYYQRKGADKLTWSRVHKYKSLAAQGMILSGFLIAISILVSAFVPSTLLLILWIIGSLVTDGLVYIFVQLRYIRTLS